MNPCELLLKNKIVDLFLTLPNKQQSCRYVFLSSRSYYQSNLIKLLKEIKEGGILDAG